MNQITRISRAALAILLVAGSVAAPARLAAQDGPQRLTLSEAQAIIQAAQRDAARRNLQLSIAVVDGRGDLIAAIFGRPSADLAANSSSPLYQNMNAATGGRVRFLQGALPIMRDGYTVGAVGASGASSQDDEDNVRAALAAVGL